jgi:hypothetical protein
MPVDGSAVGTLCFVVLLPDAFFRTSYKVRTPLQYLKSHPWLSRPPPRT